MTKRNKKKVVDSRWEKKVSEGREVKPDDKYVKPPVQARNDKQKEFLSALKSHQVVVFVAPAGVGKSFLLMSEATDWLKKGIIDKITFCRPAVGMGNTLGLLKGGMREKYEPYLLPLIDVVRKRYGYNFYENCINNGTIELLPLEYARGRSIDHLLVVEECQNTSPDEIYTMITRIEETGKLVLIGDPSQNDLKGENSLQWLPKFIEDNPELKEFIKVIEATSDDIERSGLCKAMVKAKEKSSRK